MFDYFKVNPNSDDATNPVGLETYFIVQIKDWESPILLSLHTMNVGEFYQHNNIRLTIIYPSLDHWQRFLLAC